MNNINENDNYANNRNIFDNNIFINDNSLDENIKNKYNIGN